MTRYLTSLLIGFLCLTGSVSLAQQGPLRIIITDGVIEPLPFAVPDLVPATPASAEVASQLARVIAADLSGTGLFREVPASAYISQVTDFQAPIQYADWKAVNAQALITGSVRTDGDQLTVQFRVYDVFSGAELGNGLQFTGTTAGWRRMAHKVADAVYSRITGEGGYFDSRVVFVSETGPKDQRRKRLAIMDYDGANVQYLTDSAAIVLAPRFSPTGDRVLYTSYESGSPRIYVLDIGQVQRRVLESQEGAMSFAPRFAPDGQTVVYSLEQGGNTDIFAMSIGTGQSTRLTNAPSIETAPSYSPDGSRIVFESDRSGEQQIYMMNADGSNQRRITFFGGRAATPEWSPRGDQIAFTYIPGDFNIATMSPDGRNFRKLTDGWQDEAPTWAPNGRVLQFFRTERNTGRTAIYQVDLTGENLRRLPTPVDASDPAWGPILP